MTGSTRRTGAETKAEAQRVALALFSAQGYEATSMRQIADGLGINKASLYYHFTNKEEIVAATMADRGAEAAELLAWARAQPQTPDLLQRTVLRWIDTSSVDKLRGIRFLAANPLLLRSTAGSGTLLRDSLGALVAMFTADLDGVREVQVRMAFLSINAAVSAAGARVADEDVVAAARATALAILDQLGR